MQEINTIEKYLYKNIYLNPYIYAYMALMPLGLFLGFIIGFIVTLVDIFASTKYTIVYEKILLSTIIPFIGTSTVILGFFIILPPLIITRICTTIISINLKKIQKIDKDINGILTITQNIRLSTIILIKIRYLFFIVLSKKGKENLNKNTRSIINILYKRLILIGEELSNQISLQKNDLMKTSINLQSIGGELKNTILLQKVRIDKKIEQFEELQKRLVKM